MTQQTQETYVFRSKNLIDKNILASIRTRIGGNYSLDQPRWNDGKDVSESGWIYQIACLEEEGLSPSEIDFIKQNGLELLTSPKSIIEKKDPPAFLRKIMD